MPDVDLGIASDATQGDTHGRVKLQKIAKYPNSPKLDVAVTSPQSIEFLVNTNNETSFEAAKFIFTARFGRDLRVLAVLDSWGNLSLRGRVNENQTNLTY
ncbi:DUF6342 family protein [Streptosporangium canum]|uniref:DUF6342 family protein n=1 Tax=Streptosporangium canum TaxID=324952 RepID=UPI003430467D